jgi:hypothetical protein
MPMDALRESFRKAREAFGRYMQAVDGTAEQTRALRAYVEAHAEYTLLFDKELQEEAERGKATVPKSAITACRFQLHRRARRDSSPADGPRPIQAPRLLPPPR